MEYTCHSTKLEFTQLFKTTQMFINADCMARYLILYTYGNGSDWNTWIQKLRNVSQYFYPKSAHITREAFKWTNGF